MRTIFSVRDNDFRMKESAELVYEMTKKEVGEEMNLTFDELIEQLTPAKKKLVLSAIELFKREQANGISGITSSRDAYKILSPLMCDLGHEEFWVLFLNQANKVQKRMKISSGGISETAVDIRLILKNAILCGTSGIILSHNHPSGNRLPSSADENFTRKIKEAAKLMDIRVLDHVIIAKDTYFSFADEGKM